jgi:pimeloyl-ACP methyl ester carboxylesterase
LLLALAAIALLLAIGVPAGFYLAQDRLLFFRQPLTEARRADVIRRFPAVEELMLEAADGTRLHAWHVKPRTAAPAPLAIYFGGNAEEASWMLESVGDPADGATPGIGWLIVDYRGYGASGGEPSEAALFIDAIAWFDRAEKLSEVDPRRIFAFGRSLGSGVAVDLAAQRPLAGVVLVTPYDSMAAVAKHHYPWLPVDSMLKHRFDSLALAPSLHAPLLMLIAEHDQVIPPAHAERLYDAWGGPKEKLILRGATHNSTDGDPQFWPAIGRFLARGPA